MWDQMLRSRRQGVDLPLPLWARRALAADSELWLIPIIVLPLVIVWRKVIGSWVDYDYWWHVTLGDWIIDNRTLHHTDPFSWTASDKVVIHHEWLSEVLFALTSRAAGYAGTMLLITVIAAAGFWRLLQGARYYGLSWRAACGLMLLWGGIPLWGLAVRPQVIGWALLGVLIAELAAYETGRRRRLWLLPPLFVLWVNLNLSAFIGLGVLGVFAIAYVLRRQPDRHLILICALSVVALLINPHGLELWRRMIIFSTQTDAPRYSFIFEYQRPRLNETPLRWFWLATPMVLPALWLFLRRPWPLPWLAVLVIGTLAASLKAERYIPFFGIFLFPFAGWMVWQWARAMLAERERERERLAGRAVRRERERSGWTPPVRQRPAPVLWGPVYVIAASLASAAVVMALVASREPSQFGREPKPWGYPTATVQTLIDQYPQARLFNSYSYGGYLINKLYPHGIKVFIDGREEIQYGRQIILDWLSITRAERGWQDYFAARGINAVLIERNSNLATQLDQDPTWKVASVDDVSALWVRAVRPQDCRREASLRAAPESAGPTTVEFVNGGSAPFQLFRLDETGARQPVATVQRGQRTTQETFESQPWVATDAAGTCIGVFQPLSIPSSVTLMPLAPAAQAGTFLAIDTFNDLSKALLPGPLTDQFGSSGYVDGEYVIARTNPAFDGNWTVYLPGAYADTSLNVTTRLVGQTERRVIELRCRTELLPNGTVNGYALQVDAARTAYTIVRRDARNTTVLAQGTTPAIGPALERNALEFTCAGNRLSVNINGAAVALATDDTYTKGLLGLGITGIPGVAGVQDVRFDDLVVTQR